MSTEIRREHTAPADTTLEVLLPLDHTHRNALRNADATWTFRCGDDIVGFATIRAQSLPGRRATVARFTAVHALPGLDARALRAAVARAFEAEIARERPGLSCHWADNAHTETHMSPRARAAAGDAIAVLSAHLAWAGLNNSPPLRRVG